jgi:hypothetical protein
MSRRSPNRKETGPSQSDTSVNRGLDAETLDFIQKHLTSYLKWEVLKFYGENPSAVETPRAFARRLGKESRQITEVMKSLSRSGLLRNGTDSEGFALAGDESQRAILQKIVTASRTNNRFRLQLNYHITKATLEKYKSNRP